ncbi:hypothetical protein MACK_001792 [Theileria orientalis]|uniref:Uncharacterized protein n=1 Tax=Theileria orientalis TaxID=68886 RepID=A0A976MB08_THEOR|nr:hypothetical protein MACK_001792 [Theileria orientalis]
MKEVDKTYDRVIGGGLKLKGKLISKSKRNNKVPKLDQSSSSSVDSSVAQEGKDYLTIPIDKDYKKESSGDSEGLYARNPGQSKSDILKERIDRVKNNPNLTSSEKTFKIAQIKRTYQRIENSLKESHREKIEKFNSKLSKLSEHFDIPKVGPG